MKKIFILGLFVGIASVSVANAELVADTVVTESEVTTVEPVSVVEEPVEYQPEFDETVDDVVIIDEEPEEGEVPQEYPVPTEDIPD